MMQAIEKSFLKRISLSPVIVVFLFITCLTVLFVLTVMVEKKDIFSMDNAATAFVNAHATLGLTRFMTFMTFFGSQTFLVPANLLLICFYLLIKKKKRTAIHITTVSVVSLCILFLLKDIVKRSRPLKHILPYNAHEYSFPSGHAVSSVTFCAILIYIAWRNIENIWLRWVTVILLFLMPVLIGSSRIYLGAHYASDVVAGYCVGTIWLLLAVWLLLKRRNDPTKNMDPTTVPVAAEDGRS